MRIGMIWAEARGAGGRGAIGRDGDMPWHLPEDLAHFKRTTLGAPVIMGRRTWESLPERFRPLSGRSNVVVTSDAAYAAPQPEIAWVMGGGRLYRSAMPLADVLIVTRIDLDVPDADTFAPEIGPEWRLTDTGKSRVAASGLSYCFERWERLCSAAHSLEHGHLRPRP